MNRKLIVSTIMVVLALVTGSGYLVLRGSSNGQSGVIPGGVSLVRPAMAQTSSFLDTEAGMSAYTNTGLTINLNDARSAFRIVERETTDWIVGSVPVPGYAEEEDVHVFVDKSGWIVAYYFRGEPVAKTLHWTGHPTLGVNRLLQVLTQVAGSAGVPVISPGYFNYEFQNATEWSIIVDDDSFEVTIPIQFFVRERSYSHFVTDGNACGYSQYDNSRVTIDISLIHATCYNGTYSDLISPTLLNPDIVHTVASPENNTTGSVAISLLYRP